MHNLSVYPESSFEKTTRWLSLFLLGPILLGLSLPVALHIAHKPDYGFKMHRMSVVSVKGGGQAAQAGIQVGDQILALDGLPTTRPYQFYAAMAGVAPTDSLAISLRQANGKNIFRKLPSTAPTPSDMIQRYSFWVVGFSFLLMGWWVFFRLHDPVARNFWFVCLIFSFFLMDIPDHHKIGRASCRERV